MKYFQTGILVILMSVFSYAGNKTGNGGFVTECVPPTADRLASSREVLDIVEGDLKYHRRIHYLSLFNSYDENVMELLKRVARKDPGLAQDLMLIYKEFTQSLIYEKDLRDYDVRDIINTPVMAHYQCDFKLVIVQRKEDFGKVYYHIDKRTWSNLKNSQKAYLTLHEIYYTYLISKYSDVSNSDAVRSFVYDIATM